MLKIYNFIDQIVKKDEFTISIHSEKNGVFSTDIPKFVTF